MLQRKTKILFCCVRYGVDLVGKHIDGDSLSGLREELVIGLVPLISRKEGSLGLDTVVQLGEVRCASGLKVLKFLQEFVHKLSFYPIKYTISLPTADGVQEFP